MMEESESEKRARMIGGAVKGLNREHQSTQRRKKLVGNEWGERGGKRQTDGEKAEAKDKSRGKRKKDGEKAVEKDKRMARNKTKGQ